MRPTSINGLLEAVSVQQAWMRASVSRNPTSGLAYTRHSQSSRSLRQ